MNFRNRLYRLQYRSVKTQQAYDFNEQTLEREFAKQVQAIDTTLQIMYMAFRNNISMQEVYLDLIKAQGKNVKIRGKECQKVYELLSDNKTAEIMFGQIYENEEKQRKEREQFGFQKQCKKANELMLTTLCRTFRNISTEDSEPSKKIIQSKLSQGGVQLFQQNDLRRKQEKKQIFLMNYMNSAYRRLYSRLVQETIKKITYYIINKSKLYEMLIFSIGEISRRLETILRRIKNLKDTKMILDLVKIIFEENLLIEKRIYQALVSEGHVVSIQEFFRINGEMLQEDIIIPQLTISAMSPTNQQQETVGMKKSGKFFQHHKGVNDESSLFVNKKIGYIKNLPQQEDYELVIDDEKEVQERSDKLQKNVLHIQRMHKEIQIKYNYALDKISDLMISNEEKIEHEESILIQESQPKEKEFQLMSDRTNNGNGEDKQKDKDKNKVIGGILQQLQQGPFERWKRQNNRRRTTKKKTSGFQYFSSQFKKVITELDEKKGKIKLGTEKSSSVTENNTEKKIKIEQTFQVGKITNETVSLKNPLNVARLLGKRFKTIGSSQFHYINKDKHIRNMSRQRTQINNLLKIYENNKKGNNISNILQKKEKDLIKANLLKKLDLKKSKTSNEQDNQKLNNGNRQSTINVMKQVKDEQNMLMESLENCGNIFNEMDLKFVNESLIKKISSGTEKTKSCVIDLIGSSLRLGKKEDENYTQSIFKTQILTNSPNNTRNNSLFNSPNKSPRKQVSIESLKVSNLQRVYNQFTNPLNLKYGFYNDQNYRFLMKSLQKCELNTLKIKKGILKRENLFVVKENFIFGESNLSSSRFIKTTSPQPFKNLSLSKIQRSTHPNLKTLKNELQTPQSSNLYFTTSSQFSQQRIAPLHSKDMDKHILKCIQKNSINFKEKNQSFNNIKFCQNFPSVRQNQSQIVKIDSLRITPRNSIGKKNQVYSTQRRIKMK